MSEPNPNTACEHGHQRRKCPYCELVQLEALLEVARAGLEKYGRHTGSGSLSGCQFGKATNRNHPCTCGLDTLRAKLGGEG